MANRRLVAGPWVGEFGWEIMSWQGYLRRLAPNYGEIIVCGFAGNDALYEDFIHDYIPHRINGLRDCWWTSPRNPAELAGLISYLRSLGGDMIMPSRRISIEHQTFISYGDPNQMPRYDVLIHARKPVGRCPGRSWPLVNWNVLIRRLLRHGLRIAAMGTEAYVPEGVIDFTRLNLEETMDLIATSTMIVGPSSGPMHLASLCGTPQLVWSDAKRYSAIGCNNQLRYRQVWNPFRTPYRLLDAYDWQPPIPLVEVAVLECLDRWKRRQRQCFSEVSSASGVAVL